MSNEYTDYAAEEKKHTDTHPVNKIYIMHKRIYFFFFMYYMYFSMTRNFAQHGCRIMKRHLVSLKSTKTDVKIAITSVKLNFIPKRRPNISNDTVFCGPGHIEVKCNHTQQWEFIYGTK